MGFTTVIVHSFVFVMIIIFLTALAMNFSSSIRSTGTAMLEQEESLEKRLDADITITEILTNNSMVEVWVKNTGKIKLDVNKTDLYVNDERIPRNNSDLSMTIETDYFNAGLWEPDDVLYIAYDQAIGSAEVIVTSGYGAKDYGVRN